MPTDKYKVSAYLDEEDLKLLEQLALAHRTSKSQAIIFAIRKAVGEEATDLIPTRLSNAKRVTLEEVELLIESKLSELSGDSNRVSKQYIELLVEDKLQELSKFPNLPSGVSKQALESLIASKLEELPSGVNEDIEEVISALKNNLKSLERQIQDCKASLCAPSKTNDDAAEEVKEKKANLPPVSEEAITQTELASHLGISKSLMRSWITKREEGKPFSPRSNRRSWREFTTHWEKIETSEGDRWVAL